MKRFALNAALVLASAVVAALVGEILLRFAGVSYPVFYAYEDKRGFYALRPGATGWFKKEGTSHVVVNSAGLRDREHERLKPENTLRIAVLGDSYAEAMQVDAKETFWAILEKELGSCAALSGRKVETINFGVSGYGTAQEWITLQKQGWDYDPDIVLLAFLTGNDIRNNSLDLERNPRIPYFKVEGDTGRPVLHSPQHNSSSRARALLGERLHDFLLDHSRIMQLVLQLREGWKARNALDPDPPDANDEAGLDNQIYLEPRDESWRAAWETTEAIVRAMNHEVRGRGRTFFVATLSNAIQVHPDKQARAAFEKRLGIADSLYPDRRIAALAAEERIPAVTLAPYLRQWAEANNTCVHGFENSVPCAGHWNQHGHRVAGEVLARQLCAQVLGAK